MAEEKTYDEYMAEVRAEIKRKYGSVASFYSTEKLEKKVGKSLATLQPLLSVGGNTKSFPTLQKLYKILFGRTLTQEVIVTRTILIREK